MEIIIVFILLIIYILSFINIINIYIEKSIDPGFWAITIAVIPILNTFIVIKYGKFDSDFGDIINDEISKRLYYFDTEHTIVKNWNNQDIIELDKNDKYYWIAFIMCKKYEQL